MLGNTKIKNINVHVNSQDKGSQNFKISVSDFGIPKMYSTSPNKKNTHIYTHTHTYIYIYIYTHTYIHAYIIRLVSKCQSNTFSIHKYQGSIFHYLQGICRIFFCIYLFIYSDIYW